MFSRWAITASRVVATSRSRTRSISESMGCLNAISPASSPPGLARRSMAPHDPRPDKSAHEVVVLSRGRSQPEAGPQLTRLQAGEQIARPVAVDQAQAAAPAAPLGRHRAQPHALAVARAQRLADLAQPVDQAELERAPAEPGLAAEQLGLVGLQLGAAARAHQRFEVLVDLGLQPLQALDILRPLRREAVEQRLALARGVEPALDAELLDRAIEAEPGADHADRADDRA